MAHSPSVACRAIGGAPRDRSAGPARHVGLLHDPDVQGVDVSVSRLPSRNGQSDDVEAAPRLL